MKQLFYFLLTMSLIISLFTACCIFKKPDTATYDKGVTINGVKWATRNVDTPGTFAPTTESAGKLYQWNRQTAWNTTGNVSCWSTIKPECTVWEKSNDPSPNGWRVPTFDELNTLLDTTKVISVCATSSSVPGRKFIDKSTGNSIFFPFVNWRDFRDGSVVGYSRGEYCNVGYYWASTLHSENYPYRTGFSCEGAGWNGYYFSYGISIRPVAE